jgi:hypothetical protein
MTNHYPTSEITALLEKLEQEQLLKNVTVSIRHIQVGYYLKERETRGPIGLIGYRGPNVTAPP